MAAGAAALFGGPGAALAQLARPEPWKSLRATTPLPTPVESGRERIGDVELYYAIYGKGQPVIFLHPGLGHADYWANQVGPLSQTHQVVVLDLRGHGRSTRSDKPLSYRLLADDVMKLMQKLHLGASTVVGWGDGAVIGLDLAMRHPGRLKELVAFGVSYDVAGQQPGVDQTPTFIEYVHKTGIDYERLAPPPQDFDVVFKQMEQLWTAEPHYTAEQLRSIKVPTAILAAEYDEWVRFEHAQEAAALIPNAQFVLLSDVSHFAPWQAPKKFNDALKLILKY